MDELVRFLFVGLIAGWLASILVKERGLRRRRVGVLGYVAVGMVGAVIGGFMFEQAGIGGGAGFLGSIFTATVGAAVLLVVVRLIRS